MNKLYRSTNDSMLAGLCGGIAKWLGIDSTVIRLLVIIAAVFSFGTVALIYFIAALIVPKEPYGEYPFYNRNF